jgi:hypothetical protein
MRHPLQAAAKRKFAPRARIDPVPEEDFFNNSMPPALTPRAVGATLKPRYRIQTGFGSLLQPAVSTHSPELRLGPVPQLPAYRSINLFHEGYGL